MKNFILLSLLTSSILYARYSTEPNDLKQPTDNNSSYILAVADDLTEYNYEYADDPESTVEASDTAIPKTETPSPATAVPVDNVTTNPQVNTPNTDIPLDSNTPLDSDINAYPDTYPNTYPNTYPDTYPDTYPNAYPDTAGNPISPRSENYPNVDPNKVQGIIINMPFTNIIIKPPIAPYQTYDTSLLKSGRIPDMSSSKSMLQNLDKTYWRLKFYSHPDTQYMDSLILEIKDADLKIITMPKGSYKPILIPPVKPDTGETSLKVFVPGEEQVSTYRLTLVKSLRQGEGIYAYDAGNSLIHFIYLRLVMPHMLAFDMAVTYDKIALSPDKSLDKMGVFTLE